MNPPLAHFPLGRVGFFLLSFSPALLLPSSVPSPSLLSTSCLLQSNSSFTKSSLPHVTLPFAPALAVCLLGDLPLLWNPKAVSIWLSFWVSLNLSFYKCGLSPPRVLPFFSPSKDYCLWLLPTDPWAHQDSEKSGMSLDTSSLVLMAPGLSPGHLWDSALKPPFSDHCT